MVAGSAEAEFVSARRVDDDVRTGLQRQSGRVKIIGFCVIAEADVHHGNGGRLRRLGGRFLLCRRGGFRGLLCIRRRLLRCGFRFCGGNTFFYSNSDIEDDEVMLEMAFLAD